MGYAATKELFMLNPSSSEAGPRSHGSLIWAANDLEFHTCIYIYILYICKYGPVGKDGFRAVE